MLNVLGGEIRTGVPVVGLEPSCVAVFRDELGNMMPNDENARRLAAQTFTLAELLARYAPDWTVPTLAGAALVQVHCHQGAVLGFGSEEALLKRLGLQVTVPDAGCCGMAGSFGYEAGQNYDVSIACGERVLLPLVRGAAPECLIIADGFSCREQIAQNTGRRALHLAQVLRLGMQIDALDAYPENGAWVPPAHPAGSRRRRTLLAAAGATAAAAAAITARTVVAGKRQH
ncbi:MAG TPA: hypothetical protein VLI70_07175 [Micrococcaceae bacterium]|nr:hypothetical protein [Micrococcaceae bacterium]